MIDVPRMLAALGIEARARGSDWWAKCPYPDHVEKDASWHIENSPGSPTHGLHHCFGCAQGGGPIELVAAVIGCTYSGAQLWMTEKQLYSADVARGLDVGMRVKPVATAGFRLPVEFVRRPLADWPTPVRRYVAARGITPGQVERWGIGYVVDGRLAGRVVFPICDEHGVEQGYSARTFVGDERRYLTPHTREQPDPGAIFGAEYWAGRRAEVVVTEGAIDALACERAGAGCVAALGGSRLSREQLLVLGSFERLLVATDPDLAGERVAAELRDALGRWRQVRRVRLPAGTDAAKLPVEALRAALDVPRHGDGAVVRGGP